MTRIAYVVSSHGYGHATRAAAVLEELLARDPAVEIVVVTSTPRWLFRDVLSSGRVTLWTLPTDVGFVQHDAVAEDAASTAAAARDYLAALPQRARRLGDRLIRAGVERVVADIAPLGLLAAHLAAIPSTLIESFTWDWLYQRRPESELAALATPMAELFALASERWRCAPWCGEAELGDRLVEPIVRRLVAPRDEIRGALGVGSDDLMVLATMGGFGWSWNLSHLARVPRVDRDGRSIVLVAPGLVEPGAGPACGGLPGVVRLPHRHHFRHPDLVAAADAVVGKLGYGTVVETARAGVRLGFVRRPSFAESPELERWVSSSLGGLGLDPENLIDGTWIDVIEPLLALPAPRPVPAGGAEQVARLLLRRRPAKEATS